MAQFFQDDYLTCDKCGSKKHVFHKVNAFDQKTKELTLQAYLSECAQCHSYTDLPKNFFDKE